MSLKQTEIAKEITEREKTKGRQTSIAEVTRTLQHFFSILADKPEKESKEFLANRVSYYRRKEAIKWE